MLRNLLILIGLSFSVLAWSADRGYFGFALSTEFEGSFLNPVLSSATISKVLPDSAAAKAGLTAGDVVLELDDNPLPGAKDDALKKLKALIDRAAHPGDRLNMKLRRVNGEVYLATLIAEPRR